MEFLFSIISLVPLNKCRMGESIEQIFEDFMRDTMGGNIELDFSSDDNAFSFTNQAFRLANSLVDSIYVDASVG